MLTKAVNPALAEFQRTTPIMLMTDEDTCHFHIFVGPWTEFSDCDRAKDYLTKLGLSFTTDPHAPAPSRPSRSAICRRSRSTNWEAENRRDNIILALTIAGYPAKAEAAEMNVPARHPLLVVMMIYVCMVYGPMAAFLVDLFPARIRYTSLSLPYHIGNGWFGGMLPLIATAMVAASGNIYYGLWYPVIVALITFVIGLFFLRRPVVGDYDPH